MTAEQIVAGVGVYAGTFVVALVGSLVPLISIEVFLIALVLTRGDDGVIAIVLLAAAGQLAGKLPIYFGARGLVTLPGSQRDRLERLRRWVAARRHGSTMMLAGSALLGVPPFSIAASAAGVLAIRVPVFCVVVGIGRALRFAAIVGLTLR
jgi:membrane protein YqaA with SNARE-associated domain